MTERSSSEDRSDSGGWKTVYFKTAGDAVAEANTILGLQPGTVVTVVFTIGDDRRALLYYFE
jgi:hypothetical protein